MAESAVKFLFTAAEDYGESSAPHLFEEKAERETNKRILGSFLLSDSYSLELEVETEDPRCLAQKTSSHSIKPQQIARTPLQ
ncbi:hypothetical protein ACLOJK_022055 [Asimina triloba]